VYAVPFYQSFYVTGECNMKKSLCFYVVCLIVGIGLVVATLPINFAWAEELGDCTESQAESNADCDNPAPCIASGCVSIGNGYFAALAENIRNYGNCHNGWWDYGCVSCKKYYCAKGVRYITRDTQGQCQFSIEEFFITKNDACIPTN
jgi:hypothetical protein